MSNFKYHLPKIFDGAVTMAVSVGMFVTRTYWYVFIVEEVMMLVEVTELSDQQDCRIADDAVYFVRKNWSKFSWGAVEWTFRNMGHQGFKYSSSRRLRSSEFWFQISKVTSRIVIPSSCYNCWRHLWSSCIWILHAWSSSFKFGRFWKGIWILEGTI